MQNSYYYNPISTYAYLSNFGPLHDTTKFTCPILISGYHHIGLAGESKARGAFIIHKFNKIPSHLKQTPKIFLKIPSQPLEGHNFILCYHIFQF